jgi:predicted CoA-binding protein
MSQANSHSKQYVIEKILENTSTIAVVGFSSEPYKAGYYVPAYLQQQGYRIFAVNPFLESGLDGPAYPDLASVPEPVDLVLLFRRSDAIPPFVDQAIEIGAKAVWMQLGIINENAAAKARQAGLDVVMDACMMVEHRRSQAGL